MAAKKAPKGPPAPRFEGALSGFRSRRRGGEVVFGWARDRATGRAATVDIFLDDLLVATTRPVGFRPSRLGLGASLYGFRANLPPNFACGENLTLTAKARTDDGWVEIGRIDMRTAPFGERLAGVSPVLPLNIRAPNAGTGTTTAAAIILTQDGSEVLLDLLNSIVLHEAGRFRRIVVVDHASTDDTAQVVEEFAKVLPLTRIARPRAGTFSESNNLAARGCDEDALFFINNDVVLTEPCVDELIAHLAPDVGLVGMRLMDPFVGGGALKHRAAQHRGVHFTPTVEGILPSHSRWFTDAPAANDAALEVPAVTAAVVAARRTTYEALGGFDERFQFGMEDVDLSLRSLKAGYRNVCVNNVSAVHIGSATRRRTSRASIRRNRHNEREFNTLWATELQQLLTRGRFEKPGFWGGRRVTFGFVLPEDGQASWRERRALDAFGRSVLEQFPANLFVLRSAAPVDANQLDVVVVADPNLDPRKVQKLGAATTLVAWVVGDAESWVGKPWRNAFHLWLADPPLSEGLAERLGHPVKPFPFGRDATADESATRFLAALAAFAAEP